MQRPKSSNRHIHIQTSNVDLRHVFRTFWGCPKKRRRFKFIVHKLYGMWARHALHGLRTLVSCTSKLHSRYPSSKMYEGGSMQVTLPGVRHLCKMLPALAVSEHPWRNNRSAVVFSHHHRETLCSTIHGNDMSADFLMNTASNVSLPRDLLTRWPSIAWFGIGAKRGSHNCVSRSMADLPASGRTSDHDTRFDEGLRLCREYVFHR